MRVIAGSAGGRTLKSPPGNQTRPTADKTKGAIFSMLESLLLRAEPGTRQPERETHEGESEPTHAESEYTPGDVWQGLQILDLYAGTGALAIEALSRGAGGADLVEQSRATCRVIEENLRLTGLEGGATLHCRSVNSFLSGSHPPIRYDIILLDPPYADTGLTLTLRTIIDGQLARPGGLVMAEHAHRLPLPAEIDGQAGKLIAERVRRHGDTTISIYRYIPLPE